jgi:hypothetical protein
LICPIVKGQRPKNKQQFATMYKQRKRRGRRRRNRIKQPTHTIFSRLDIISQRLKTKKKIIYLPEFCTDSQFLNRRNVQYFLMVATKGLHKENLSFPPPFYNKTFFVCAQQLLNHQFVGKSCFGNRKLIWQLFRFSLKKHVFNNHLTFFVRFSKVGFPFQSAVDLDWGFPTNTTDKKQKQAGRKEALYLHFISIFVHILSRRKTFSFVI